MADPFENKKKGLEKDAEEEGEEEEEEEYEDNISKSYFSSFQFGFTTFSNISKKIEELGLNDQKDVDIEIGGSKKEPSGISFEIINFDKTKNNEFYDQNRIY